MTSVFICVLKSATRLIRAATSNGENGPSKACGGGAATPAATLGSPMACPKGGAQEVEAAQLPPPFPSTSSTITISSSNHFKKSLLR